MSNQIIKVTGKFDYFTSGLDEDDVIMPLIEAVGEARPEVQPYTYVEDPIFEWHVILPLDKVVEYAIVPVGELKGNTFFVIWRQTNPALIGEYMIPNTQPDPIIGEFPDDFEAIKEVVRVVDETLLAPEGWWHVIPEITSDDDDDMYNDDDDGTEEDDDED